MTTTSRLWIPGAADPEMAAIEQLLVECGERVVHATVGGTRARSDNAYRVDPIAADADRVYLVECARDPLHTGDRLMSDCPPGSDPESEGSRFWREIHLDHHRPGDPGFGAPPAEFLRASSLGQVIVELARLGAIAQAGWVHDGSPSADVYNGEWHGPDATGAWRIDGYRVPAALVFTAAADHCLGAAYAGQCPSVDPSALMSWRAESRATFQRREVDAVLADIAAAKAALDEAPRLILENTPGTHCGGGKCGCRVGGYGYGGTTSIGTGDCYCGCDGCHDGDRDVVVADMRGRHVPELPEAGTRYGIAYVADGLPGPDGRTKVVCSGGRAVTEAFLNDWGPRHGLVDCYGDPARGFAGGYLP